MGAEILSHKLQSLNKDDGSLRTGFCSLGKTTRTPFVSTLRTLGMRGMLDNKWVLKLEFRKENKTEAVQTDTWEGQRLEYFSLL